MTSPTRLAIVLDAGRRKQRRVHQSAGAYHHPVSIKLTGNSLEQGAVLPATHQRRAEADEGGPFRRWLVVREATKPPEAGAIVERFGQMHVRKVVPRREQQRAEKSKRRPARLAFRRSRDTDKQSIQFCPIQQEGNLIQRRALATGRATNGKSLLPDLTPRHGCLHPVAAGMEPDWIASDQAICAQVS